MVPVGCKYKKQGWGERQHRGNHTEKDQLAKFQKAVEKRAKALRNKMPEDVDAYFAEIDAQEAAAKRAKAKAEKMENEIGEKLKAEMLHLSFGDHTGTRATLTLTASYHEVTDWDGYSKRCKFPMVIRSFTLNIRKGWHLFRIGGSHSLREPRLSVKVWLEWIEQGSIADIRTVKGFLVRGEHIEAKTLKEAINTEHRAMQLARLLSTKEG